MLSAAAPLKILELKTYDLRFVLRGKRLPPAGVVLVMIDERTETAFPEPRVFWHPHYAAVLRAAGAGRARAIGLDVLFTLSVEQWMPDADRQLAAAFAEVSSGVPVILGYDTLQTGPAILPLYLLASSQDAIGFTNLTLDPDGSARRQELMDRSGARSFATRLAEAIWNSPPAAPERAGRSARFANRTVPLNSGCMTIHYWGPGGTFPAVSMVDVLTAAAKQDTAQLERWFGGKIVLIGFQDSKDTHPTPFYLSSTANRWGTAGIEIHANALSTLLEQRFLREVAPVTGLLLTFLGAALAAVCVSRFGFPWSPVALLGCVGACFAAAVICQQRGLVLPVVAPLMGVLFSGLGSSGVFALTEGRNRRLLQDVFGRYVSSDVAREILKYGEIPLRGVRQQVTVLFSDLRNFTSYCQGRDPQQVVQELNEYFSQMTGAIKAQGGMVNKFIGDGIMALFGAPLPGPDDALSAVRCALEMVRRNEEYNNGRAAAGLLPLVIGIGIHTGEAVVGTIGAPEKMEYTAIGDTVNVASRIEGENKTFQTRLLISEVTYQLVRDRVRADPAGLAELKGVDQPVLLYKILGLREDQS